MSARNVGGQLMSARNVGGQLMSGRNVGGQLRPDELAIEASGLAKSYGAVRVLNGIDLRVPPGGARPNCSSSSS